MAGRNISYMPLTATPFRHNDQYGEISSDNLELAKYIRCFWGSENPYGEIRKIAEASVIIPDTCVVSAELTTQVFFIMNVSSPGIWFLYLRFGFTHGVPILSRKIP